MNRRLIYWSVTSALAGFLFGFDTVVISGAEQTIQKLWGLDGWQHGLAMGAALYGTVIGSLIGSWPTDRYGRKNTLIGIGVLYILSAVGCGFAWDVWSLSAARIIGGLGIGISTVAAPLYISEISPPSHRGRLAGMFQFNIVFGILIAFLSNYLFSTWAGEHAWRWMLGIAAIPSVIYTFLCFGLPESPRWLLVRKQNRPGALRVLALIEPSRSSSELEAEADHITAAALRQKPGTAPSASPRSSSDSPYTTPGDSPSQSSTIHSLKRPLTLAFLIAFFNQLSGINAILYFAPRIFEKTGLAEHTALLTSVGNGITNLIFTFVGLWLIDRLGRRTLLYIGSYGYILSLGLCSWAFFSGNLSIVPVCIFAFIAAHAVGQGAVIWVFISEIFPDRHRAAGQSLGSATHWVFAALLTTFFPVVAERLDMSWIFLFFTFMMILQLIWVKTMVPETKGVALENMSRQLSLH